MGKLRIIEITLLTLLITTALSLSASAQVVTITYAHTDPNPALMRMVELFNMEHPDIRVEFAAVAGYDEAIPVQIAAGTGPDVFYVHPMHVGPWSRGVLLDLTPFIEREADELLLDEYFPIALELSKADGRFYSWPYGFVETGRVLYNAELLAAAGVAEPTSDWIWPEYKSLAQRLTLDRDGDGEPDQFGTNRFDYRGIIHYYMAEGGRFFSEGFREFLPDRQAAINAFEFAASFDLERLASTSWVTDFLNGSLVFALVHLPSTVNQGGEAAKLFPVGSTIAPRHVNGSRKFFILPNQLGINPHSSEERQRAAWTFIRWVNSPEGYARASREAFGACQLYPARRDAALSDYCAGSDIPGIRPELSMEIIAEYGVPELAPPNWAEIRNEFYSAWTEQVLTGKMAPAVFYDSVIVPINAALRQSAE